MNDIYSRKNDYYDTLNLLQKKFFLVDGFYIAINQNFTNNIFYYFLCLFFRFIPLIILSGNYIYIFTENNNSQTLYKYLQLFTLSHYTKISYVTYLLFNLLIYIIFIIRIIFYFLINRKYNNYKYTNKWPFPKNFRIFCDHLLFLIFPYLLEYLSFGYYICFFPDTFIITIKSRKSYSLFIIIIINTFLIVVYNIIN